MPAAETVTPYRTLRSAATAEASCGHAGLPTNGTSNSSGPQLRPLQARRCHRSRRLLSQSRSHRRSRPSWLDEAGLPPAAAATVPVVKAPLPEARVPAKSVPLGPAPPRMEHIGPLPRKSPPPIAPKSIPRPPPPAPRVPSPREDAHGQQVAPALTQAQ